MDEVSPIKITVAVLWHLGCVTSACCAQMFDVIKLDENRSVVEQLNSGKAPLFEPGLEELIKEGVSSNRLRFTSDIASACASTDVLGVTYDTPVNDAMRRITHSS